MMLSYIVSASFCRLDRILGRVNKFRATEADYLNNYSTTPIYFDSIIQVAIATIALVVILMILMPTRLGMELLNMIILAISCKASSIRESDVIPL